MYNFFVCVLSHKNPSSLPSCCSATSYFLLIYSVYSHNIQLILWMWHYHLITYKEVNVYFLIFAFLVVPPLFTCIECHLYHLLTLTIMDILSRQLIQGGVSPCLTDCRWPKALPDALPASLHTPHLGEIQQSMSEARQMIAAKITFRKSNKNSLEHHAGAYRSSRKRNAL